MKISPPTAIIFDCDGVLVDSEVLSSEAHARALTAIGYPISAEEALRRFQGLSEYQMYDVIAADWGRPLPADYDDRYKATINEIYRHRLQPIDGVIEAVNSIDLPKGVASNSAAGMLDMKLRHVGLYDRFAPNIFSISQVKRGKPAPDLYLYAAEHMGFAPEDCIVVEDSVPGVRAARSAGMRVLGFTGATHAGPKPDAKLMAEGALLTFDDMRRLPALLTDIRAQA